MYNVQVYLKGSGSLVSLKGLDVVFPDTDIGDPISKLSTWLLNKTLVEVKESCSLSKISSDPNKVGQKPFSMNSKIVEVRKVLQT